MAALKCIAAARTGFLLAALHSVAKSIRRRPAYHPTQQPPLTSPGGRRVARFDVVPRGRTPDSCDLPHPWGTCLACYRTGTKLQVVIAGAGIAEIGRASCRERVEWQMVDVWLKRKQTR